MGAVARVAIIVTRFGGEALLRAIEAAAARLQREAAEIDALNVYPLPDGDTGRNMYQTLAAALVRARAAHEAGARTASAMSDALAQGALRGARGNSGVILSQILRGLHEAFAGKDEIGADDLRDGFRRAREKAYAAVERPADGTMLSLCGELVDRTDASANVGAVLRTATATGVDALERTMDANPLNRAAGVVDAGAYGIWVLLAGALAATEGEAAVAAIRSPRLRRPGSEGPISVQAPAEVASWTGGHCVQYVIPSPRRPIEELRREMVDLGADSVLVVGDASLAKVHVHAARPEAVVAVGESAGDLEDLIVEDFDQMVAEHERATGMVLRSPPRELAAIAVVPGDGLAEIVRSLHAVPMRGGATMNPSVGEIRSAIESANARTVVLLPNDRNVILAAQEAAKMSECRVEVIPTKNVPQGMAALVAFDPMASAQPGSGTRQDVDTVVRHMREATGDAHAVEVTFATRDTTVDGVRVAAGQAIALLDGRLVAQAADAVDALAEAAAKLEAVEIATVYAGADVSDADAERAAERLRETLDGAEVEVRRGGQPHYPFIVQAE